MLPRVCALSLLLLTVGSYGVESYSQVAIAGSGTGHEDGPKVFKALNMDLIFPKSFNSSENVISTTQTSAPQTVTEGVESLSSTADEQFTPEHSSSQTSVPEPLVPANHYPTAFVVPDNHADESEEREATVPPSATGRAIDYHPAYTFPQLLTPTNTKGYGPSAEPYPLRSRPASRPSTASVVYPSYQASRTPSRAEIDKLSGKGQFPDRSIPNDAIVSQLPPSNFIREQPQSYMPSKYSFNTKTYPSDYPASVLANKPRFASADDEKDITRVDGYQDNEVINYGRAFNLPGSSIVSKLLEAWSETQASEARVKKYSYFFIARRAWYHPLFYSVFFSGYVLWLVLKSITDHASKLPDQYKERVRSFGDTDKEKVREILDMITITVMNGQFSDRFTPSEGVISNSFKQKANRIRKPSNSRPIGQSSNKVSSFVPTQNLYTFPPNVNSRYPSPLDVKQASPSDTVTSYLPPAAGPLDTGKFVGPVNPDLLSNGPPKDMGGAGYLYNPPQPALNDNLASKANGGGYQYSPPQPPLDANLGKAMGSGDTGPPPGMMDVGPPVPPKDVGLMLISQPTPAENPAMINGPPPSPVDLPDDNDQPDDQDHDHDFHHDDHEHHEYNHDTGGYVDDNEYPTPPPGYLEEHDHDHDHDYDHDHHHHHHHPDIDFSHGPYFHDHHHDYDHHYPDVIYDDYHDHHFHHDHLIEHVVETEPPMTTPAPPPPPPPEPEQPRVKKYSYFYIGRKLWYIPLWFTLYFTFYILWLILKSIARHKVNLPNHYVSRRSIFEDLNHREAREAIDRLTCTVMDGIEKFKLKYIG